MTITFLLPHVRLSGGVRVILEYANRLKARGHAVRLMVLPEKPRWYRLLRRLKARLKPVKTLPPGVVDWFDNTIPIEVLPRPACNLLPEADILVATAWQTAAFAAQAAPRHGKVIYFIQGYESLWSGKGEEAERTYRLPFHKIVVSTWLQSILKNEYQQASEVFITPINRERFFFTERTLHSPRRVLMLHHNYEFKGYRDGIAAVRRVREAGKALDLVVFGEKVKDASRLFNEAGFEFEYHFRPTGDALRNIYASADIFMCTSWHEGFGLPGMEALACGAALVTTDTGGSRDYAVHNQTALVSPPRDPEKLAANLMSLLDDDELLLRLAKQGRQKVLEFDWEENTERLVRRFDKVRRATGNA